MGALNALQYFGIIVRLYKFILYLYVFSLLFKVLIMLILFVDGYDEYAFDVLLKFFILYFLEHCRAGRAFIGVFYAG